MLRSIAARYSSPSFAWIITWTIPTSARIKGQFDHQERTGPYSQIGKKGRKWKCWTKMINFTVFIIFSETGPAKDPRLKLAISFHSQRALSSAPRDSASGFGILFRSSPKLYLCFTSGVLLVCPFGLQPNPCAQAVSFMTIFQFDLI